MTNKLQNSIKRIHIKKEGIGILNSTEDHVAVEDPLEIRVQSFDKMVDRTISITMRTPTNDEDLGIGFLVTEGIISSKNQITDIKKVDENTVTVYLSEKTEISLQKTERNFYTTSSCGVCGKASIDAIRVQPNYQVEKAVPLIDKNILFKLHQTLKAQQSLFSLTGGIHAAAIFDTEGNLKFLREDVGRHNALDKIIGNAFMNDLLPLNDKILLLSGRASFELIQKASMAGIPIIAAIGAPSSLAVELAEGHNHTLVGFLKKESFNIYCGYERIKK